MYQITDTPKAVPMTRARVQHTAPLAASCMGSTSVFGTNGNPAGIGGTAVVRDAKQAAPPRGELR